MPSKDEAPQEPQAQAEAVFRQYRERRERGEKVRIDDYCRRFPDLANALRFLESMEERPLGASEVEGLTKLAGDLESSAAEDGDWEESLDELTARAPAPGDSIGRYELASEIGRGGFGTVFLAIQSEPIRREVALKLLSFGARDREVLTRFKLECQALALMQHPNIANVFDVGVTEGNQPYLVMEYVRGSPIHEYCDRERLDLRRRLEVFTRVCTAVQHAHLKGIIHRDLKPSNILAETGESEEIIPKVIDFGLAKALDRRLSGETLMTQPGQFMGTPIYMSPEQAGGETLEIDARTDIYSLGVILYQLLSGTLPFDMERLRGRDFGELLRILREEDPPSPSSALSRSVDGGDENAARRGHIPSSLRRALRHDLDWITMKALEKDPGRRYASAADLAADIERYLKHEPVLAGPPSVLYRGRKFVRKHRVGVAVVALITALVSGLTLASAYREDARFREQVREGRAAVERGDIEEAKQKLAALVESRPDHPSTIATRRQVVEAIREEARGSWREFLRLESSELSLHQEWENETEAQPNWRPVWFRKAELQLWKAYERARRDKDQHYDAALLLLHDALGVAEPNSPEMRSVRRLLEEMYWHRREEARQKGSVEQLASFFERMVESFGVGTHAKELEGSDTVTFSTDPPGADVYCFRYEEHEAHLIPLPYRPGKGVVGEPLLKVDEVWQPELSPFEKGDRIREIRGESVRLRTELVDALANVEEDERVNVTVVRGGQSVNLEWTPFRKETNVAMGAIASEFRPNELISFYDQFGFTIEGYPLQLLESNLLGTTSAGSRMNIHLPRGSYLFVFAKEGYTDVRLPIAIPVEGPAGGADGGEHHREVRLLREKQIPPGLVFVPGGRVATGGDRHAFQSLERGIADVAGFFIGRLEITTREWLEFVNDPEVHRRIDGRGRALPVTESAKKILRATPTGLTQVQLIPLIKTTLLWDRPSDEAPWELTPKYGRDASLPILCVSQLAAIEYADWRTRQAAAAGEPWSYRLPTDVEWERAARGLDRRAFVWGDYLVWSFCWSNPGIFFDRKPPRRGGTSPLDESIFGVRDLAGSVCEHTTGEPLKGEPFTAYRGGSWKSTDVAFFRIASRNGMVPWEHYSYFGVRLVAEPAP